MTKRKNVFVRITIAVLCIGMISASAPAAVIPVGAHASISGTVNSHGNCTYYNGQPLCTGMLSPVQGCTVSVHASGVLLPVAQSYTAITDKNGHYSIDSIPITQNGDAFYVVASAGPSYSVARQEMPLSYGQSYTANFNLELSFTNTSVVTNDSLTFTVSTDKKSYTAGDSMRIRYSIQNRTTHAITYYYNSGCEYDLLMTGTNHDTLYWLGKNRFCTTLDWLDSIPADSKRNTQFPAMAITSAMDSIMTVTARATSFSITGSTVSITVYVNKQTSGISHEPALRKGVSSLVSSAANGCIFVFLPHSQCVSLSLFTTAGRLIRRILDKRTLPAGRSEIAVQSPVAAPSVYIAVLRGEGLSIAEAIHGVK